MTCRWVMFDPFVLFIHLLCLVQTHKSFSWFPVSLERTRILNERQVLFSHREGQNACQSTSESRIIVHSHLIALIVLPVVNVALIPGRRPPHQGTGKAVGVWPLRLKELPAVIAGVGGGCGPVMRANWGIVPDTNDKATAGAPKSVVQLALCPCQGFRFLCSVRGVLRSQ